MSKTRIFDLHCDTLDRLALYGSPLVDFTDYGRFAPKERMSSLYDNDGHISLNRMQDLAYCQCFAAFIPDGLSLAESWHVFETARTFLESQCNTYKTYIRQIRDAHDIMDALNQNQCAALLTVEGGSFLAPEEGCDEERIEEIYFDGVKMLTLTWNGDNAIGSGHKTHDGLSSFGRRAVKSLEEHRIVVDVSHLNDEGFRDVAMMAQRPFAASHSNARSICGHVRNLTDEQIKTLVSCEGLIGVNYYNDFISETHAQPTPEDLLWHVDHMLELGGEHVLALGSDYDGSNVPNWLCPAEKCGTLHGLFASEFGQTVADDICFNNAHRFFVRNEEM